MKNLLIFLLLLIANLTFAEAEKEPRETLEFTAVEASKGVNITLVQCNKFALEVVTDGCPTSDVVTEVKNGTLYVKMSKKTTGSAVQVWVYFKDINSLKVKQGATAETGCHFEHKGDFKIDVGAMSEIDLDVDLDTLIINGNSCNITLAGDAKKQVIDLMGAVVQAEYDATRLVTQDIDITISNTQAQVRFNNSLTANVKSGLLKYLGDEEKTDISTSLEGKAEKLN